jgi:hypothetical protein
LCHLFPSSIIHLWQRRGNEKRGNVK